MDLPGYAKKDVHVSFENNTLTVYAKNAQSTKSAEGRVLRKERFFGEFSRKFSFPANRVDPTKITASLTDGVLHIDLSKYKNDPPSASGRIQIN
jgi:HSP20 family protein